MKKDADDDTGDLHNDWVDNQIQEKEALARCYLGRLDKPLHVLPRGYKKLRCLSMDKREFNQWIQESNIKANQKRKTLQHKEVTQFRSVPKMLSRSQQATTEPPKPQQIKNKDSMKNLLMATKKRSQTPLAPISNLKQAPNTDLILNEPGIKLFKIKTKNPIATSKVS